MFRWCRLNICADFRESLMQSTNSFLANFIACYAEMEDWMICGLEVASGVLRLPSGSRVCPEDLACRRSLEQEQKVSEKWCQVLLITELLQRLYDCVTVNFRSRLQLDVLVCVGMIERLLMSLVS